MNAIQPEVRTEAVSPIFLDGSSLVIEESVALGRIEIDPYDGEQICIVLEGTKEEVEAIKCLKRRDDVVIGKYHDREIVNVHLGPKISILVPRAFPLAKLRAEFDRRLRAAN